MAKPKTKTSTEIHYGYAKKHYDILSLKLPKGSREKLKRLADEEGVTTSEYIRDAIEQKSGEDFTLDKDLPWLKK